MKPLNLDIDDLIFFYTQQSHLSYCSNLITLYEGYKINLRNKWTNWMDSEHVIQYYGHFCLENDRNILWDVIKESIWERRKNLRVIIMFLKRHMNIEVN